MDGSTFRGHCMALPGVTEGLPFGEDVLVFKVGGKMFALLVLKASPLRVNLKCDPDRAIMLRQQHSGVLPGYHMSKVHWNTVIQDGSVDDAMLLELMHHSYELIVAGLPKKIQRVLKAD